MAVDRQTLSALAADAEQFYVRDRRFARAQATMRALLAGEGDIPEAQVDEYLAEVQRYFGGFEREARAHLSDVERRLTKVSQVQFNLAAERGVAERRVSVTQGVLSKAAKLGRS
jgi:hypothetical protein